MTHVAICDMWHEDPHQFKFSRNPLPALLPPPCPPARRPCFQPASRCVGLGGGGHHHVCEGVGRVIIIIIIIMCVRVWGGSSSCVCGCGEGHHHVRV